MYNDQKYLIIRNWKPPINKAVLSKYHDGDFKKMNLIFPSNIKYRTVNDNPCISDCKLPGRYVKHPINNIKITDYQAPFCATEKWYDNVDKKIKYHDLCKQTDLNIHLMSDPDALQWHDIESSTFSAARPDECKKILNMYHNIQSFKDLEEWSTKTMLDDITKRRVINCAWNAFRKEEKQYVKKLQFAKTDYFTNLANTKWFSELYNGLNEFFPFELTESEVKFKIKELISNKKTIKQILNKFIRNEEYKHPIFMLDWFQINEYEEDIKIFIIQYLRHHVSSQTI
ncbi:hypothetical protein N9T73_00205 [bacterium]|nr:hypothetical protein [bacterium]